MCIFGAKVPELNNSPIKAIAFDLDGTLLTSEKQITPRTIEMIRRIAGQGILTVIATGRSLDTAIPYISDLALTLPLICYNGACVRDMDRKVDLWHDTMSLEATRDILSIPRKPSVHLQLFIQHALYFEKGGEYADHLEPLSAQLGIVADFQSLPTQPLTKAMFIGPHDDTVGISQTITKHFPNTLDVVYSHPDYLEVMPAKINKGTALARLLALYGITAEQTMAFGDGDNDLEMLTWAGHGVAMGNASPRVMAAVLRKTGRNNDEGVADYLESFFVPGTKFIPYSL